MYRAAVCIAAMLIAQTILLSASISTSASSEVSGLNYFFSSCADSGQTSSHCSSILEVPPLPVGYAESEIWGNWNMAEAGYDIEERSGGGCVRYLLPTAAAAWTVNDTITITGSTGPAVLIVRFSTNATSPGRSDFSVLVNGMVATAGTGTTPAGGFSVPFTFGEPFPLTFGVVAQSRLNGAFQASNSATIALLPAEVYRTGSLTTDDRIFGIEVTRESGADFGAPEASSFSLCMAAALLLLAGRISWRTKTKKTHS